MAKNSAPVETKNTPAPDEDEDLPTDTTFGFTSVQGEIAVVKIVSKGGKVIERKVGRPQHPLLARDDFKRELLYFYPSIYGGNY